MILVNTDYINGKVLKMIGFVKGCVLEQQGGSFGGASGTYGVSSLKSMSGGGGDLLTGVMDKARDTALNNMVDEAKKLGADAVINIKYNSAMISGSAVEIMYTGTAVKFVRVNSNTGF